MYSDLSLGYAGFYHRFDTVSKKEGSTLFSADNLVGDRFSIVFKTEDGAVTAWMVNRFGGEVGFFDAETSRQLQIYQARGWEIAAVLSFVAYTNAPDPGIYWGEAAVICFDPTSHKEAFDTFISTVGAMIGRSVRPDVSLSRDGVERVIASNGTWEPTARIPLPKKEENTVIVKKKRSFGDAVIEEGRKGKLGCYVLSWIFIAVVVAALIFGVYSLLSGSGLI